MVVLVTNAGSRCTFLGQLHLSRPARRRATCYHPTMAYNARRRRHRQPKPDRRRALELLAGCGPEGCSEAVMKAHGFTTEQLVELVRSGLASATPTHVRAGREVLEVAALRITAQGWKAVVGTKA